MAGNGPILNVHDVSVTINGNRILDRVSFTLERDETVAVVGPNGAGKTVLFRAILGLVPHTGTIDFASNVKIGYVPQRFAVERDIPLTVGEFLSLRHSNREKIIEVLRNVDPFHRSPEDGEEIDHNAVRFLKQRLGILSGGQLQKVLIAWALLGEPTLLLFDEPTAGLDVGGEETVYGLLHRLQQKQNLAMLLISHDLSVVYRYAQRVLCLNKKTVCFGAPKEVLEPKIFRELYGDATGFYAHHT